MILAMIAIMLNMMNIDDTICVITTVVIMYVIFMIMSSYGDTLGVLC